MQFEFNKFVGLISLIGTVVGAVMGGATVSSNIFIGAIFFLVAIVSLIMFVGFLYHFIRYAEYEMPVEKVQDEIEEET